MAATGFKHADLSQLVKPDEFRRALAKIIGMSVVDFERASKFTEAYADSFTEAGYAPDSLERHAAIASLTAFNHALFEKGM